MIQILGSKSQVGKPLFIRLPDLWTSLGHLGHVSSRRSPPRSFWADGCHGGPPAPSSGTRELHSPDTRDPRPLRPSRPVEFATWRQVSDGSPMVTGLRCRQVTIDGDTDEVREAGIVRTSRSIECLVSRGRRDQPASLGLGRE